MYNISVVCDSCQFWVLDSHEEYLWKWLQIFKQLERKDYNVAFQSFSAPKKIDSFFIFQELQTVREEAVLMLSKVKHTTVAASRLLTASKIQAERSYNAIGKFCPFESVPSSHCNCDAISYSLFHCPSFPFILSTPPMYALLLWYKIFWSCTVFSLPPFLNSISLKLKILSG